MGNDPTPEPAAPTVVQEAQAAPAPTTQETQQDGTSVPVRTAPAVPTGGGEQALRVQAGAGTEDEQGKKEEQPPAEESGAPASRPEGAGSTEQGGSSSSPAGRPETTVSTPAAQPGTPEAPKTPRQQAEDSLRLVLRAAGYTDEKDLDRLVGQLLPKDATDASIQYILERVSGLRKDERTRRLLERATRRLTRRAKKGEISPEQIAIKQFQILTTTNPQEIKKLRNEFPSGFKQFWMWLIRILGLVAPVVIAQSLKQLREDTGF